MIQVGSKRCRRPGPDGRLSRIDLHARAHTGRGRITLLGRDAAIEIIQNEQLADNTTAGDDVYLASSDLTIASRDNQEALEAIGSLQRDLADYPDHVTQEDQTRYFLESVANETEPLVPIEVPHHHVEVTRAVYESAAEGQPVTLPLDKDDPFYSFEGGCPAPLLRAGQGSAAVTKCRRRVAGNSRPVLGLLGRFDGFSRRCWRERARPGCLGAF